MMEINPIESEDIWPSQPESDSSFPLGKKNSVLLGSIGSSQSSLDVISIQEVLELLIDILLVIVGLQRLYLTSGLILNKLFKLFESI